MRAVDRIFAIATVPLIIAMFVDGANAAGDPAKGELIFAKCASCHTKDKSNRTGPGLLGVAGRQAGSVQGFHYSRAMKAANVVWDDKSLDAFIAAPQKAVPGTVMPFAGLPDQQQRTDLIAYLETLK